MHNIYEAYRRMYEAMGVQNIDAILMQPPQPQPKDPATENSEILGGMPAIAHFKDRTTWHTLRHTFL